MFCGYVGGVEDGGRGDYVVFEVKMLNISVRSVGLIRLPTI